MQHPTASIHLVVSTHDTTQRTCETHMCSLMACIMDPTCPWSRYPQPIICYRSNQRLHFYLFFFFFWRGGRGSASINACLCLCCIKGGVNVQTSSKVAFSRACRAPEHQKKKKNQTDRCDCSSAGIGRCLLSGHHLISSCRRWLWKKWLAGYQQPLDCG